MAKTTQVLRNWPPLAKTLQKRIEISFFEIHGIHGIFMAFGWFFMAFSRFFTVPPIYRFSCFVFFVFFGFFRVFPVFSRFLHWILSLRGFHTHFMKIMKSNHFTRTSQSQGVSLLNECKPMGNTLGWLKTCDFNMSVVPRSSLVSNKCESYVFHATRTDHPRNRPISCEIGSRHPNVNLSVFKKTPYDFPTLGIFTETSRTSSKA